MALRGSFCFTAHSNKYNPWGGYRRVGESPSNHAGFRHISEHFRKAVRFTRGVCVC